MFIDVVPPLISFFFFFNDTATTEIYTLSLHDALPIWPGRSGKPTNLHYVYGRVPDARRGRMVSLATQTDRTLFFDFLPIDLGQISGFATRFQLYTVPGQVYYNATRRLVLQGADGVVFVADSQARQLDENLESLQNLQSN